MPRKGEVPKRKPLPDPKFTDQPVDLRRRITKFVNTVMESGKKAIAEGIVYGALDLVAEKAADDPVKVWDKALANVQPKIEVKSRRVGGATYQVPVDVRPDRALALGMRWLIHSARERSDGRTMREKLAAELLDASNNKGAAVKKREDTHTMRSPSRAARTSARTTSTAWRRRTRRSRTTAGRRTTIHPRESTRQHTVKKIRAR